MKTFEFINDTKSLIHISLEPWAEDYHLNPNDTFTLHHDNSLEGYFQMSSIKESWLELHIIDGNDYPDMVTINDIRVECGHNRPKGMFENI